MDAPLGTPPPPPPAERERELGCLDELAARAVAGDGAVALVLGDAGMGKTSVLDAARARLGDGGLRVLRARGTELEQPHAYGVAHQLLDRALQQVDDEELWRGAAAHARTIFHPGERPATGGDVAFARRQGLYWLLAAMAERLGPLALLVDDAQWVDEPTIEFLLHLALRLEGLPVVVVLAARPLEGLPQGAALHELAADAAVVRLELGALSAAWVATLVRDLWGEPPPGLAEAVRAATGGNPLLTRELVDELRGRADGGPPPREVPQLREVGVRTVAERLRRDLGRETPDALALAQVLAVLGDDGALEDAVELAGLEPARADQAVTALLRRRVTRSDAGTLRFAHPVLRTSVLTTLTPLERRRLHRRAAELLHERRPRDHRTAVLLLDAPPLGEPWVRDVLRGAAERAVELGAPATAARYLRRALEEPGEDAGTLLRSLARVESQAGISEGLARYALALEAEADPGERLALAQEQAGALSMAGRTDDAFGALDGEIAAAGAAADAGQRAALHALALFGRTERALELRRVHLEELEARWPWVPAEPGERALAAVLAYERAIRPGPSEPALEAAAAAFAGDGFPAELAASPAFGYGIWALVLGGRLTEAGIELDRVGAAARASGAAVVAALTDCLRALAHLRAGDLLAAEADASQSLALTDQPSWGFGRVACTVFLAAALLEQGRVAQARDAHDAVPAALLAVESNVTDLFRKMRADLLLAEGRCAEAATEALAVGESLEARGWQNPGFAPWRSTAARALAAVGEHGDAQALAREEVALARTTGVAASIAPSLLTLAETARQLEPEPLVEARDLARAAGTRLVEARSQVALGRCERIGGERRAARETLRAGLALAQRCGALALADEALEELAQAGGRPRRAQAEGTEALTASESRVARLAAEGRTNREIAQQLYVAQKTVEMHLRNAYRKLDVAGRAQLASALGVEEHATADYDSRPGPDSSDG